MDAGSNPATATNHTNPKNKTKMKNERLLLTAQHWQRRFFGTPAHVNITFGGTPEQTYINIFICNKGRFPFSKYIDLGSDDTLALHELNEVCNEIDKELKLSNQ